MSSLQREADSENSELDEEIRRAEEMIEKNLSAFYSRGVPAMNLWMAVSFFTKMKQHEVSLTSPSTIMYLACLVVSGLTDLEMKMMFLTKEFSRRWMIAYLSTILQISAAAALMLFFNTTDTVLVFVLFGLVLIPVIYFFHHMFGRGKVPGLNWLHFKELLERGFEMSALVVAPSVAGLSGKVLGYVKGSSNLTGTAVAPECFLFYSAVFGLLVVLFCTVPPSLIFWRNIRRMAQVYIPIMAYIALWFLVMATIMAAEKILQDYVYFVCSPIGILAVLLYLFDAAEGSSGFCLPRINPSSRLNDVRQEEAKLSNYVSTASMSPFLLAIMAIHSSYGIGSGSTVSLGWSWKAFVGSAVCNILSHTVRIFIVNRMTERKGYEISRCVWNACICGTIITTVCFAVLVICLHTDEVKNIF